MTMQHSDCVERAVMRVLQKRLKSKLVFDSDKAYAEFDLNPRLYKDPDLFKRDYVICSFLRKWKGLDTGIKLEEVTFNGWRSAEELCFRTNHRLEHEASTGFYSVAPRIISDAQRKILMILGRFNFNSIAPLCRFGPGATSDLRRGSTVPVKMLARPTVTFDCIPFVCRVVDNYWSEKIGGFNDLNIVRSNRMLMVPKSSKTHRMIAAEPTLNGFIQQGVGRFIRKRLKNFGIDLGDQTINQDLAFSALVDGLSTIDLSSASDTLSVNLVKLLLPPDWFEALDAMRSKFSTYKGQTFLLNKFSSMGNAYTFELESLIFWALTSSAINDVDGVCSVYGDDIVVKNEHFAQVEEVLTWAGFRFNYDKSFTAPSQFFESCGKHYFDLEDVTPPYQKDVCTRPADFIRLYNRLVRSSIRLGLVSEFIDARRVVLDYYRSLFPRAPISFGPLSEDDRYFADPLYRWPDGMEFVVINCLCESSLIVDHTEETECMRFAYKLRHFQNLNQSREGWVSETGTLRTSFRKVRVWRTPESGVTRLAWRPAATRAFGRVVA